MTLSRPAAWNPCSRARCTPSRRRGADGRCRPCSCRATTGRSPGGGATRPCAVRPPQGPNSSAETPWTTPIGVLLVRPVFRSTANLWHTEMSTRLDAGCAQTSQRPHRVPRCALCACPTRGTAVMHTLIQDIENAAKRSDVPDFRPGDTLKVHVRVTEGSRSRIQVFQGVVIRRQGGGARETFTVRKVSYSVGVERTFPLNSPSIDKIEVVTRGDVRRAKLYYLRELRGKAARIKEKRDN